MLKVFGRILVLAGLVVGLSACQSSAYRGYKLSPYRIRGVHYQPMSIAEALGHREEGMASWYDERKWFGISRGKTALGEPYRPGVQAGAHKTLPLPCRVRVINLDNGRSTIVRLNDRGPFVKGRMLDVTPKVASQLKFRNQGVAHVRLEVISVGDGSYERTP